MRQSKEKKLELLPKGKVESHPAFLIINCVSLAFVFFTSRGSCTVAYL